MTLVKQQNTFPEALLTATPESIYSLCPDPTIFHISGRHKDPLFVSVLLHGNEITGFLALQKILNKYHQKELPRSISFFLGNTEAASQGLRRLDHQPDFNRVWPGTDLVKTKETQMAKEIVEVMRHKNIFASIDIHNNTGLNPQYACINSLDNQFLQLANLFSRLVVYFIRPKGVQSAAFANICPAVTLECGKPGQANGVNHAFEYLNSCLHLTQLSKNPVPHQDIDIFHTVAQVKINQNISFSFTNKNNDLLLDSELERMNFTEIPTGTLLGQLSDNIALPLTAMDETGKIVSKQFFTVVNNYLQTCKTVMPSMLTLDEKVIKQDCFCYLMERIKL